MSELGRPITASGLQKIEAHTRRVDADDLVALAVALGVSPVAILLPGTSEPGDSVSVTGVGAADALAVWEWANGGRPLREADPLLCEGIDFDADAERFYSQQSAHHERKRSRIYETPASGDPQAMAALEGVLVAFLRLGVVDRDDVLEALAVAELTARARERASGSDG